MGEAKRRGSFEQRKEESEAKYEAECEAAAKRKAEYEASLTPEQRAKREKARKISTILAAFGAGNIL